MLMKVGECSLDKREKEMNQKEKTTDPKTLEFEETLETYSFIHLLSISYLFDTYHVPTARHQKYNDKQDMEIPAFMNLTFQLRVRQVIAK